MRCRAYEGMWESRRKLLYGREEAQRPMRQALSSLSSGSECLVSTSGDKAPNIDGNNEISRGHLQPRADKRARRCEERDNGCSENGHPGDDGPASDESDGEPFRVLVGLSEYRHSDPEEHDTRHEESDEGALWDPP